MTQITLPSGATAVLRPAEQVTERLRRPIKRIQTKLAGMPAFASAVEEAEATGGKNLSMDQQLKIAAGMGEAFDLLEELNDHLVVAAVMSWSYPFAVTVEGAQDLPGRDLDALREHTASYMKALMPDFGPSPEADSPTVPSIA